MPKMPPISLKRRRIGNVMSQKNAPSRMNGMATAPANASARALKMTKVTILIGIYGTDIVQVPRVPGPRPIETLLAGVPEDLVQHEAPADFLHGDPLGLERDAREASSIASSSALSRGSAPRRSCLARMAATST